MRTVEIFTAGCPVCEPTIKLVKETACDSCDITVYDLSQNPIDKAATDKLVTYGINRIPSIVVDGKLLDCCDRQITKEDLVKAGIGQSQV